MYVQTELPQTFYVTIGGIWMITLAISILTIVCCWKIFEKAGVSGWMALIPFLNTFKLFEIACGNGFKMLFLLIPVFNVFYGILTIHKLSKAFGYGIGLTILYFIATPTALLILAFGNNVYYGPY